MKKLNKAWTIRSGTALAFFLYSLGAFATLGEPVNSIENDMSIMAATRRNSSIHRRYRMQEIGSSATRVREYSTSSGIVFGIAWDGPAPPDLTQLLGTYAQDYQDALKETSKSPGRRSQAIKGSRVVVENWGHMRNLQGRAYDPALLPSGVTPSEIK